MDTEATVDDPVDLREKIRRLVNELHDRRFTDNPFAP
jgi:hypothetical protein